MASVASSAPVAVVRNPYDDIRYVKSIGKNGNKKNELYQPTFMALHPDGNIVVADTGNNRLQVFNPDGTHVRTIGKTASSTKGGKANDEFKIPLGLAFNTNSDNIIVADRDNHRVQVLKYSDGSHVRTIGIGSKGSGKGEFNHPCSVAVDADDNIYVYDAGNSRIQKFKSDGQHIATIGINADTSSYRGAIALDGDTNIIVALRNSLQVIRLSDGVDVQTIGAKGDGDGDGQFNGIRGIAFHGAGNILVADSENRRVQVLKYPSGKHVKTINRSTPSQTDERLTSITYPQDVLIDSHRNIIVSTWNTSGGHLLFFSGAPPAAAVAPPAVVASPPASAIVASPAALALAPPTLAPAIVASPAALALAPPTLAPAVVASPPADASPPTTLAPAVVASHPAAVASASPAALASTLAPPPADASPPTTLAPAVVASHPAAVASAPPPPALALVPAAVGSATNPDYTNYNLLQTIGSGKDAANGQFKTPTFMALHPIRDEIVVADTGNNRLQVIQLSDGACLRTIGGVKGFGNDQFNAPYGVAFTTSGDNIIVADINNQRVQVLKYSDGSHVRTIGIGSKGIGNGEFNNPYSVAVDSNDNIYVYDAGNNRIQMFNVNGDFIRYDSLKSNGNYGGIAINHIGDQLIAVESKEGKLNVFSFPQMNSLKLIGDDFKQPRGVAFDRAGNIIVADTGNNRVQVLDNAGKHIKTIDAGNQPYGVLIDRTDRIIVSDTTTNQINIFGIGKALAPAPPPKPATFRAKILASASEAGASLSDAASAAKGALSDTASKAGTALSLVGSKAGTALGHAASKATDAAAALGEAASTAKGVIVTGLAKIGAPGKSASSSAPTSSTPKSPDYANYNFLRTIGSGPGDSNEQFNEPRFMALHPDGDIVVVDTKNNRLKVIQPIVGAYKGTIGSKGSGAGQFESPRGVAFNPAGDNIIVADTGNNRVQVLKYPSGSHVRTIGSQGSGNAQFDGPCSVAVDSNDNIYVYDANNKRIQVFDVNGAYTRTIKGKSLLSMGADFSGNGSITIDSNNNLIVVADGDNNRVLVMNSTDGKILHIIGKKGTNGGEFEFPQGVACDNAGNIIVADTDNNRMQVIRIRDGTCIRTIGGQGNDNGQFAGPFGVLINNQGDIIVSDSGNHRIQVFGNIFKNLRRLLNDKTSDDMLALIPNVYRTQSTTGKDLIYTDEDNPRMVYSLTSEQPDFEKMIAMFNNITDPKTKQFYLAFSRNIQKNFETTDTDTSDTDTSVDNAEQCKTLLLRLRKNSLLLQLPPTWDYATMVSNLNLFKTNIVYYFIEGDYDKKTYNYQDQVSMDQLSAEFKTYYEQEIKKYKNDIIKIFLYYIADKEVIELFNIFLELVDKVILLNEVAKVYSHPPYSYDISNFVILSDLVKALSFDNFKVGEFPFPYSLSILFDNIIQIYDWFIELYKYITGENFDKIRYIDTSECVFIGVYVYTSDSDEVKRNLPLIDSENIVRIVFSQLFIRVTMIIDRYLKKLLKNYKDDSNVINSVAEYDEKVKNSTDRYKNIQTDTNLQRDFRLRTPIKQILDNIYIYLSKNYKKYSDVNDVKYNILNITITGGDEKKGVTESSEQMNEKISEFTQGVAHISKPDKCIVFIKMLIFLISSTNNVNICTSSIQILFSNLCEFFASSSNIDAELKRKIYEYLKLVNDIFIFNAPATGETAIVDKRNKIKAIFEGLGLSLFKKVHWETQKSHKTIPNLVDKVKSLDGIIKTCNDESLKTIFNKFKDNLAYTSVTDKDKDNLKELSEYVNSMQRIMCHNPSSNIELNEKNGINEAIKEVNVILDYINRYTSSGQHGVVDVSKGGGKKHRKRYIKNKQNNNKNDNITMKKKRRNRKRAPVMKTIRNKKEQE